MTRAHSKKGRLTPIEIIVIIFGFVFIVTVGIGGVMEAKAGNNNQNPKQGLVELNGYIEKICDGPNLIYTGTESIAVSPNDPQCN